MRIEFTNPGNEVSNLHIVRSSWLPPTTKVVFRQAACGYGCAVDFPVNASDASGVDTPAESLPVSVSTNALKDLGVGAFWPTP